LSSLPQLCFPSGYLDMDKDSSNGLQTHNRCLNAICILGLW